MSTVEEIKTAIESLTPPERAELERLLLREPGGQASMTVALPNQAERRQRILGDKVLPNYALLAREGTIG